MIQKFFDALFIKLAPFDQLTAFSQTAKSEGFMSGGRSALFSVEGELFRLDRGYNSPIRLDSKEYLRRVQSNLLA